MFFSSWLQQRAQRWFPRIGGRHRRAGRVSVLTRPTMRPELEVLEDRTLPAPIGSIELGMGGPIEDPGAFPNYFPGTNDFDQSQSIDPSVGPVSIKGSSSLSATDNRVNQITAQYTITGSATATPPAQKGQPVEGDITLNANWNTAANWNAAGNFNDLPELWPAVTYGGDVTFNSNGTFKVNYVSSVTFQPEDEDSGGETFSGPGIEIPIPGGYYQFYGPPTTGSGTIEFTYKAGDTIIMQNAGIEAGGNCIVSDQESFHWTFTPNSVTPTSMSWDSTKGGLNYGYSVNGADPLTQGVPAALYWSTSKSFSDNLGKIDGTDYTIPAGTAGNASYNQHVNGTLLRDAPQGTNYLLVVIGDPNSSDFDPSADVYALQDVQVRGPANSPFPLSDKSIGEIKNLLRESGNSSATISSTVRTPYQQALAMYTNIVNKGVTSQLGLYAAPGQAVIEKYVEDVNAFAGVTDPTTKINDIINDMVAEIEAQGPYNVSHHCEDATEWAQLQVVDIVPSSLKNPALFAAYGYAEQDVVDGELSNFLGPTNGDPVYHLEIPQ